ncbi:hypothetical protein HU200_011381 [Digitaria exilis]|uniref:RING-type E3 ubiquitin transferase n=1 Tax=Digitaria exilis TaxID=1010633 RepID=A0A835FGN7_9POAL|nr:hypothetical protein HU200_011381 [Digitaria exilis]
MLTLHPRVVVASAGNAEVADGHHHDEGRACWCVGAACFSLLLFVVLAAATGSLARAGAIAAAAALVLGLAGCLAPWAPVRVVVHHRCACGLADADIGALPTFAAVLCAVCLEDVRDGEMVRQLPACRHLFHVDCVDAWLRAHRTCPLCRCELPPRRNATAKGAVTAEASADDALPPV